MKLKKYVNIWKFYIVLKYTASIEQANELWTYI